MTDSTLPEQTSTQEFIDGFRDAITVTVAASTFGMLFGATAIKNGLSFGETIFASASIFAGASQFVYLELAGLNVPAWSIILAVFAVNFRHILYSASLGRKMRNFNLFQRYFGFFFMVDPMFGAGEHRAQTRGLRPAYYFGFASNIYPNWVLFTAIGAWGGALIDDPAKYGLDFILPIYFLTLVMGFRSRANWLPVVIVSGITSALLYNTIGPPWHISLGALAGIFIAVVIGKKEPRHEQ